jgi:alpha-beta hydrolase superfamily lysophospholipase
MTPTRLLASALLLALGGALTSACPASRKSGPSLPPPLGPRLGSAPAPEGEGQAAPAIELAREDRLIEVTLPGDDGERRASLGALLVRPMEGKGPHILVVPGGGDISRHGSRPGDGVSMYPKPVEVGLAWAESFARRGAHVLLWDKRTCGPNDDPICRKNPQDDVDAEGPAALARDVDAACALARAEPGFDGRLVLFAHGQAAQVALSSTCAHEAAALVMLAPIPRAIDEVIVAGLKDRTTDAQRAARAEKEAAAKEALLERANQLKNLAGTREAEFASMKAGRFAPTARVNGATLAFWRGWMELTGKTAALVDTVPTPKIVVLGGGDKQYGEKDRVRIRALAPDAYVEVDGADHHLLTRGALAETTVDLVGAALDRVLAPPQS